MKFLLAMLLLSHWALADEMNLNEFAPTRLEDASPTDEHKIDLQLSSLFEKENPDQLQHRFNPRYGLSKKAQLEAVATFISGGEERGSGKTKFGGLYQFTDAKGLMPKIALSPFLVAPTGKYDQGYGSDSKLLLSWTFKGSSEKPDGEIHVNLGHSYNAHVKAEERFNQYLFAAGYSYRLKEHTALVMNFLHQQEQKKTEEKNLVEAGLQQGLGQDTFLGVGAGAAMGAGPSWSGNLSLIKQI